MPEISYLFGIVFQIHVDDDGPPRFHAVYGEHKAKVSVSPPGLSRGRLPPRVLALVIEWASLQEHALLDCWERLGRHHPVNRIPPLE